ncbi:MULTISPECIES: potassium/proton antiporter [unclassified Marinimicrobium]|mgnify:CR=1 FL=1|jgi:cell volume regulation protein A|uniref:potassium/proton antiporter n=1 Tax=Marinimicrobium TaxID=359337 RepID=UPI00223CB496|nr:MULTISPECIES: potassium/proton antiporter [unclassified Marinimicrobium]UZJ45011.1 potassium/proton antiporter [Marinimicrobium sp. C6131]|tara:strand:+ start:37 stop:1752 length:1716 start_codon:yes stop_codon:yes gene_type:complete
MDTLNQLILFGGMLFVISILASTLSPRMGMPLLLVFLIIGMLAGEDGLGGIRYNDVQSAYFLATLALAVILFDGGLRTDRHNFRVGLRPALLLATVGVVGTAALTGAFAAWILGIGWVEGLLIGAIVGSTDAAAVFSVLNMQGLALKTRVGATLEIESGLNDPMAIFLTIILVEFMVSQQSGFDALMLGQFVWQMGLGAGIGLLGGRILAYGVARLALSPGLYPLLALFGGISIFGLAAVLQASGFLAVYLAGLVVGNRLSRGLYNIQRFHDGIAWLAQISLFLMLGLLVSPRELMLYAPSAVLVGLFLILVGRPVAVWLCLMPFQFAWREKLFISWVGLRGAVPIVLAMFPWLAGFENWPFFFNIAFFIVLVSLVMQGWTVAPLARWLKLDVPTTSSRVQRVELGVPGQVGYEFVGYKLAEGSPALRSPTDKLPLPAGASLLCVLREDQPLSLKESHTLEPGDHVYLLASATDLPALDKLLVGVDEPDRLSAQAFFGEFVVTPRAKLADLGMLYGFEVPEEMANWSIARYIYSQYRQPVVGDRVRLGDVEFVVLDMRDSKLTQVSLKLHR